MARGISRVWFVAPALILLLALLTFWSVRSQGTIANALGGAQNAVATLTVRGGDARRAGDLLAQRLALLGVDARVQQAEAGRLVLRLNRVAEPRAALHGVVRPEPLEFAVLAADQQTDAGAGAFAPWAIAPSRRQMLQVMEGEDAVMECIAPPERGAPTQCAAWRVEARWPLTIDDVAAIELGADRKTEAPEVTLTFTEAGAQKLLRLARAAAGRTVAIVALGEVQARLDAVERQAASKALHFSTRTADTDRSEAVGRAQRIGAMKQVGRLPEVRVEQVEVVR